MGVEYRLQFQHRDGDTVAEALRPLPFCRVLSGAEGFELRARPGSGMPDASARVEPYGLYFCDHGGVGRELLGEVVARLVSRFGPVTVGEMV